MQAAIPHLGTESPCPVQITLPRRVPAEMVDPLASAPTGQESDGAPGQSDSQHTRKVVRIRVPDGGRNVFDGEPFAREQLGGPIHLLAREVLERTGVTEAPKHPADR